jgi:hypothetical protein
VVVIPCWRRPEFLWHCLDNLAQAEGVEDVRIVIRPDTGFAVDNLDVVREFSQRLPTIDIQYPTPAPYRRTKQSANVLLGYLAAAANARRYVFLVEEDIMVARDFFRWHREAQVAAGRALFCSIAVRNPNRRVSVPDEVDGFYLSSDDYCSTGVCFEKSVITSLLAPHIRLAYFRRPKRYIRQQFPNSGIGLGFVEQDGLIRRIEESSALPIAWPCVPRAFHSGFYGYNRPGGLPGSLRSRVTTLADTIYAAPESAAGERPTAVSEDCIPCLLDLPRWQALRQVEVAQTGQ